MTPELRSEGGAEVDSVTTGTCQGHSRLRDQHAQGSVLEGGLEAGEVGGSRGPGWRRQKEHAGAGPGGQAGFQSGGH